MMTPELKEAGDKLVQFWFDRDEYDIPIYDHAMRTFAFISRLIWDGKVKAAYVLDARGLAAGVSKMAFGNQLGVAFADNLKERELFENSLGDLVIEMNAEDAEKLKELCDSQEETEDLNFRIVATVTKEPVFTYGDMKITMEEALDAWESKLEKVFPTQGIQGKRRSGIPDLSCRFCLCM